MRRVFLIGVFLCGVILPVITNSPSWSFGFMAGIALVAFLNELD